MTDTAVSSCNMMSREETARWLQTYDRYLLLCHAHPDGDTLGAAMGLRNLLRAMGKTAHVICASPIPYRLSFITGERQSILLEQIPGGFLWDKVISVDVASPSLLGSYRIPFGETGHIDLAIDHHGTHVPFAGALCLDGTLSACAELVFDIGREIFGWNDTDRIMPADIAVPLYAGLNTDSGSFKYGAVTPETHHRAAAMLASMRAAGIEHAKIAERLYGSRPMSQVMAAKAAYEDLRFFCGGRVSLVTFTPETMEKYKLSDEDIDDIVNLIRGIRGVRVAIHIKPRGENVYKLSLRCEQGFNVAQIAGQFGGGGHPCASGCTIEGTADAVESAILSAVSAAFDAEGVLS